jgi:hypothetical protein
MIVIRKVDNPKTFADGGNSLPEVDKPAIFCRRSDGMMRRYRLGQSWI